jgi:hypothetical protein
LTFKAKGSTAKGALNVDGRFRWPGGVMTGQMRLSGDQLLVADTPEYRVLASPDITLRADADGYRIEGQVVIPTGAHLAARDHDVVSSSPDERIVGVDTVDDTEQQPSTANRVSSKGRRRARRATSASSPTAQGQARTAKVTVSTVPNDVARGNGTIRVAEGPVQGVRPGREGHEGLLTYHNSPLTEPEPRDRRRARDQGPRTSRWP